MIKANELRLGNWVYSLFIAHEPKKIPTQIISITGDNTDGQYDEMEPIPITPEILEKCGFEYFAWPDFLEFTHYIKDDFILRETDSGYSFFNTSKCNGADRQHLVIIQYLHKLQNLYFALTGEELEVKF